MSRQEAVAQYLTALKSGQKYYKNAEAHDESPYPVVLDDILDMSTITANINLGLVNVPVELIAGTKSIGRVSALAGNFMPLLSEGSEFALKWINLCEAHLSDEGIRDPIKCYEYMGKFYVLEGNKRASVLMSYDAATVPAMVTRLVPEYSDEHAIQVYYEFMQFYSLTGIYGVQFNHRKRYAKLIAKLGFDDDHVWTETERRSFSAGFTHFKSAFEKVCPEGSSVTAGEALLVWLGVYSFSDIKEMPQKEIVKILTTLWNDIEAEDKFTLDLNTDPVERDKGLLAKIIGLAKADSIKIAYIYAFNIETSEWTRAHDHGREYLEEKLGSKVSVKVYYSQNSDHFSAMQEAVNDGAELIFATTPTMIDSCRRIAALYPNVKVLNCSLSRPHAGVRNYYSRIYETKFVTGAIAGAMADTNLIGYVSNYPIIGVPAAINAFAQGVKLTNPRARIKLEWSCTDGDPLLSLIEQGITVISNRDATNPKNAHWALEWGCYKLLEDGSLMPLAVPCWNWGPMYEKIVESIFSGAWNDASLGQAVNYWWGMNTGVIDVQLSEALPDGTRNLAKILKAGLTIETIRPFEGRIVDNKGVVRNDGSRIFTPEEIMAMDWLCDNIDGEIPGFDELLPESKETVRLLGTYRHELPPEKQEKQL